jgi:hypothetical protein
MASVYSAARRREALAARAAHSWLAALPLAAGMRRLEAATLQLAPLALLLIAAGAAYLLVRWRFAGGGIGPAALDAVGRSLLSGALAGAAVGGAWPLPKPQFPPPGSRYVPPRAASARRGFRGAEWLGHWPVRRSFAFAQPKTLSRTVLPLLILMPMGTSAAAALLAVALLGGMTAAVFVVASLLSVTGEAGRWLQPLPIAAGRLARLLWPRSLAVLGGIGALTGWLAWVGTLALPRAILLGVALPAAAGAVAVVGGVIALRRAERR